MAKRAALLFDRLWLPASAPSELTGIPIDLTFGVTAIDSERQDHHKLILRDLLDSYHITYRTTEDPPDPADPVRMELLHEIVKTYPLSISRAYSKHGITVVPLYEHSVFNELYPDGQFTAFVAALHAIPVVDEERVSWEQIAQFREDKESLRKYRRLRSWLQSSLAANSFDEAYDIIYNRLDHYELALRKHGVQTLSGTLSLVLDHKTTFSILAAAGVGIATGNELLAAFAAGSVLASKTAIYVRERKIEKQQIDQAQGGEVAILYDIGKEFGEGKT